MSDQDSQSGDDPVDPARLYKMYRANRRAQPENQISQRRQVTENTTAEEPEMQTQTPADIAYRNYQNARSTDHAGAIDAIMNDINMEQSRNQLLQQLEQQPRGQSDSHMVETLGKVFSLPVKLLNAVTGHANKAANDDNSSLFRGAVPLAAAAMLALVVVPFVVMNSNDAPGPIGQLAAVSQVPDSLLQRSDEAVHLVTPLSGGTVGFSTDLSPSAEFMQLGITMTDLIVARAAQSIEYQQLTKSNLQRILENRQLDSVGAELTALIQGLDDDFTEDTQLSTTMAALNESIRNQHGSNGLSQWYSLGQSLEALNLSAGLTIEGQDGVALQEALKNHKALFPQESNISDDPRVNAVLQEIRMVSDEESDLLDSARQIDTAVDKIILLVN